MVPWVLGALTGDISDYVAIAGGLTAFMTGLIRYTTVLGGAPKAKVERATGVGFLLGATIGLAMVALLIAID